MPSPAVPAASVDLAAFAADVLVVGSGVAGLAAAVEVASAGLRVAVLEGAATLGGASAMSGGGCCLVDTPLQRRQGIADSVDLALLDWTRTGGSTVDVAWARQYLENSAQDVYGWCEALGVRWDALTLHEGNCVPRWHLPRGWGAAVVQALVDRALRLGVVLSPSSRVEAVERVEAVDATSSRVRVTSEEHVQELTARAVVFCTGGFAGNLEMTLRHSPQLQQLGRLLSGSSPTSQGLGHDVLVRAGAALVHLDHVWVYPTGTPDPSDSSGRRGVGVRGYDGDIWLNRDGVRFHDETRRGGSAGTAALLRQPGQTMWSVLNGDDAEGLTLLDNEHYATPAGPVPGAMREFRRSSPHVWSADSPGELARALGMPAAHVEGTLTRFNDAIRAGRRHDPDFSRDLTGLRPVEGPGMVAIQCFPLAQKSFGGVQTDLSCRVRSSGGPVLPGLYAAGELAGMAGGCINGRAALEGTMFGPCIYSGRVAGRSAAADLLSNTTPRLRGEPCAS